MSVKNGHRCTEVIRISICEGALIEVLEGLCEKLLDTDSPANGAPVVSCRLRVDRNIVKRTL